MESFFAVILAFYGMGNPPDPFFTKYICGIAVFFKDLAGDFPCLVF